MYMQEAPPYSICFPFPLFIYLFFLSLRDIGITVVCLIQTHLLVIQHLNPHAGIWTRQWALATEAVRMQRQRISFSSGEKQQEQMEILSSYNLVFISGTQITKASGSIFVGIYVLGVDYSSPKLFSHISAMAVSIFLQLSCPCVHTHSDHTDTKSQAVLQTPSHSLSPVHSLCLKPCARPEPGLGLCDKLPGNRCDLHRSSSAYTKYSGKLAGVLVW